MLHNPQRVRLITSSKSFVLLYTSFVQIRKILLSNTFMVLGICYVKHQIDGLDFDTLWHNSMQTTE